MASVLDIIKHYQQAIEKYSDDEGKVLRCIDKLFQLKVTVQHLQETGVGRTVNALRKEPGEVGQAARSLVLKWKTMVAAEESDQETDLKNDPPTQNGHGSGRDSDDHTQHSRSYNERYNSPKISTSRSNDKEQPKGMNGHHSGSKRKHHSSEEEDHDTKKLRHTSSSEDDHKNVVVKKEKVSESESSDDDSESSDSDSESYTSESSREEVKVKKETKEETKKERKESPERHKSSSSKHSNSNNVDHKRESSSSKKNDSHRTSHHKSSSKELSQHSSEPSKSSSHKHKSSHDKDSSDKRHKSDTSSDEKKESKSSSKHSSDKHRSSSSSHKHDSSSERHKSSEKHSSKEHKSSSHSDKADKHKSSVEKDVSKHKSKESSSSSKEKHSSSSKDKSKDRSSSSKDRSSQSRSSERRHSTNDSKSHNSDKSKHKKDEGSEKKSKDRSSSSSSHKSKSSSSNKLKEDVPKKKSKLSTSEDSGEDGIDCGSGASFAEALGMISPSKPKKKANIRDINSPNSSYDLPPAALLAPSARLAPLPALEISALPEISPNYKPRPPPKLLPGFFNDEDAISAGISSKNQRTKVYSGNKVIGKVTSLYEMCVHVLQEHIDALEYTGGVPYEILKPVVDRATPQQLYLLEHYNPYLMEDTDHLWKKFCEKSFRNKKRQELESWREMHMRCQEEQEHKLKSLTANIRLTQEAKKAPIKQTKMAYVDTMVKPPRSIARKQALHGTAHAATASPAARVASLSSTAGVLKGGSPRPPPAAAVSASSFNKPKKAPLMAKALQFMRGRKR